MERYDRRFFEAQRDGARRSARRTVPLLVELIHPKSVVDVGCGVGSWLSVFREFGIENVLGVDGGEEVELLEIPPECFVTHDLTTPIVLDREFELVVSLEVAEHLPPESSDAFVDLLVRLGPIVLFSAAIPGQGGTNHLNEQWPEYWALRFAARGYRVVDAIRPRIWDDPDVEWWYAQNALLFVRHDRLSTDPELTRLAAATHHSQLSIVHPRKYLGMLDWTHRIEQTRRDLADLITPGSSFVFVDSAQLEAALPPARDSIPFLERAGQYWGPPEDDAVAIHELERLRSAGAAFIAFAWPAFWWLDQYPVFHRHLMAFPRVMTNDRLIVFDLRARSV